MPRVRSWPRLGRASLSFRRRSSAFGSRQSAFLLFRFCRWRGGFCVRFVFLHSGTARQFIHPPSAYQRKTPPPRSSRNKCKHTNNTQPSCGNTSYIDTTGCCLAQASPVPGRGCRRTFASAHGLPLWQRARPWLPPHHFSRLTKASNALRRPSTYVCTTIVQRKNTKNQKYNFFAN